MRELIGPAPEGGHRRDFLVEHLHTLNEAFHGLYKRHLLALARETGIPIAEVYRVATFYRHFEILGESECAPSLTVRVCGGLTCEMAGAGELLAVLPRLLDGVKIVAAPCLARCDQAPAVQVGQSTVPCATPDEILNAVMRERTGMESTNRKTLPASALIDYEEYRADGGYALAAAVVNGEEDADFVLQALEESGLCGGGEPFSVGARWRLVRQHARAMSQPASLAIDIDGIEPGSFRERQAVERDPHRLLEGALVAAHVVGADAVYISLRSDLHDCRALLEIELAALNEDPPCRLPRIELRRGFGEGAGGDTAALLDSLEGKRPIARVDAPPVEQSGLFGRPTLVQDVETLSWVRDILRKGPRWFADFGRHGRQGLRHFSVSGRVAEPGVKLAPAGITLRELIDEYCGGMLEGHEFHASLPAYDADKGCGVVVVLSQHDKPCGNAPDVFRRTPLKSGA